jgi:tetratricopeptide (TPR) repeat protein
MSRASPVCRRPPIVAEDGDLTGRRTALAAAVAERPDDPRLCTELGSLELRAGDSDRAEAALRRAVDAEPSAERLELLGTALARQGRHDDALASLRAALELEPARATAWNLAGEAFLATGRIPAALDAFARAARHRPGLAAAHCNLGLALAGLGRHREAVVALEQALRLDGRLEGALFGLGRSLQILGRYEGAARCFRRLVELRPDDAAAHNALGSVVQLLGDYRRARAAYERAIELAPAYADAHSNLGSAYQGLRDPDAAVASYRRALAVQPDHQDALAGLAHVLDRRGRYEEALALLAPQLERHDAGSELVITAAQAERHLGRSEAAGRLLEGLLERPGLAAAARLRSLFNLGEVYDDLGEYDRAFERYREANGLKPVAFNRDEFLRDVERLLAVFAPESVAALPRLDDPDERPVFVLGMPRSGTSLVEQILACHPRVAGAGELTDLGRLAIGLGAARRERFPDSLRTATPAELRAAADDYLAVLAAVDPAASRIVDKTPANQLFIGFVAALFPRARVIHCVRHPLDTLLSCYFQNFAGQGIPYSYDFDDLATYFNQNLRVMAHWRAHPPLAMHEVVYEELVTDQEAVSRGMIEFLGLDWDPACLEFHRAGRDVATASHAQVRRPLYRSSVGRFRHYARQLEPLAAAVDWEAWRASGLAERVEACHERDG